MTGLYAPGSAADNWRPDTPTANGKEYSFPRNVYETRRMLYTLYNAIGSNWRLGKMARRYCSPAGVKVRINLTIASDLTAQSFPGRGAHQITGSRCCSDSTFH